MIFECEFCGRRVYLETDKQVFCCSAKRDEATVRAGRAAWLMLHGYAELVVDWDPEAASVFYHQSFLPAIPRNCRGKCRSYWLKITANDPPPFEDRIKFYAWTVRKHNEVNRKLGKPEWHGPFPEFARSAMD